MADAADRAGELIISHQEEALNRFMNGKYRAGRLDPVERCHSCGEAFPAGSRKLFCDAECAEDHG